MPCLLAAFVERIEQIHRSNKSGTRLYPKLGSRPEFWRIRLRSRRLLLTTLGLLCEQTLAEPPQWLAKFIINARRKAPIWRSWLARPLGFAVHRSQSRLVVSSRLVAAAAAAVEEVKALTSGHLFQHVGPLSKPAVLLLLAFFSLRRIFGGVSRLPAQKTHRPPEDQTKF